MLANRISASVSVFFAERLAMTYDDDVTPAAVQQLRDEAAQTISIGEWTVTDGYVGNNETSQRG
jgi:hypothetical protein